MFASQVRFAVRFPIGIERAAIAQDPFVGDLLQRVDVLAVQRFP